VLNKVHRFSEVNWISLITGEYDIHLISLFRNNEELDRFLIDKLSLVEGVIGFHTQICLIHYYLGKRVEDLSPSKSFSFDDLDHKIVEYFQLNARAKYKDAAKALGVKGQTLIYRVNRLVKTNVICRFTAIVDYWKLGYDFQYFVHLQINMQNFDAVIKHLVNISEVIWINVLSNLTSIMLNCCFSDRIHFYNFLRNKISPIPGIQEIKTERVLRTFGKYYL
jgi:DNA-binding Lrp family transcriptional regulator